jgi:hypothetical protein
LFSFDQNQCLSILGAWPDQLYGIVRPRCVERERERERESEILSLSSKRRRADRWNILRWNAWKILSRKYCKVVLALHFLLYRTIRSTENKDLNMLCIAPSSVFDYEGQYLGSFSKSAATNQDWSCVSFKAGRPCIPLSMVACAPFLADQPLHWFLLHGK